jgi:threonine/homoserine/homoserine lactone efflux protein
VPVGGPANIVCTMAGIKQGVKKSIPLITGINVVSILYSLLVGFGLDKVLKRYPDLTATLQILGALYLVYLDEPSMNIKYNPNSN